MPATGTASLTNCRCLSAERFLARPQSCGLMLLIPGRFFCNPCTGALAKSAKGSKKDEHR